MSTLAEPGKLLNRNPCDLALLGCGRLIAMKLLYCPHCQDVVRLFPEKRTCRCGKSWGQYLEDNSTTVQTWPSLSLGIANPDFGAARDAFVAAPDNFSPLLAMRSWINPLSEPDVTFVEGDPAESERAVPEQARSTVDAVAKDVG